MLLQNGIQVVVWFPADKLPDKDCPVAERVIGAKTVVLCRVAFDEYYVVV